MKSTLPPQFERTQILLGDDGIAALRDKHVFVAGLGGVGSYCTEALARAGIGRLTLMDHDVVATSNINRQLPALLSTVGLSKAELMQARIADINPDCRVTLIRTFLGRENVHELVPPDCDYIIDCIDSMNCKVALVAYSLGQGYKVASSMGAGNKLDPTRIKVADISETVMCPLAREMRKYLRDLGYKRGVLTVYTDEKPRPPLPPQAVDRGRPRSVNGTISYMPPIFGFMLAGAVLNRLLSGSATAPD